MHLKCDKKHKTRTFSGLFHNHNTHVLPLLGLFTDRKDRFITLPFHLLQLMKSLPFHNLMPDEKVVQPTMKSVMHGSWIPRQLSTQVPQARNMSVSKRRRTPLLFNQPHYRTVTRLLTNRKHLND